MKNKRKLILVIGIILVLVIAVSIIIVLNNENVFQKVEEKITNITFKQLITIDELKQLENTKVSIIGFLSPVSPLDGSFAYLMNIPFQTCPFCVPNTNELANTITIVPKKDNKIDYTTAPIIAEGILKFGEFIDEYEYTYSYRIEDISIRIADEELVENNILVYGSLAQEGIFDEINNIMAELDNCIYYKNNGMTEADIKSIDINKIDEIISKINQYESEEYEGILDVTKKLKELSLKINENISIKEFDELEIYQVEFENIYYSFMDWVTKFEV